eukprot:TRINITY_DN33383_c0_g1_i1.p2 TRINITY_DN33383_c0_g1~~TRINITY_DN33383_c0_g1_i1.p2  ORF type:complete len:259 (-),score=40.05 TRINITY_DN33383_c0_g1_i1:154-930(-)
MRRRLTFAVGVAALAVFAQHLRGGLPSLGPLLFELLIGGSGPPVRGLVRVEDVHPVAFEEEDDLAEVRARLSSRTNGRTLTTFFARMAEQFRRLGRLWSDSEGVGRNRSEMRIFMRESLLLAGGMLWVVVVLLVIFALFSCFVYWLIGTPMIESPFRNTALTQVLDRFLTPLDKLLSPLTRSTARTFGLTRAEALFQEPRAGAAQRGRPEDSPDLAVSRRAWRTLMGLLVLNVGVSAVVVVTLSMVVLVLRASIDVGQ